MPPLALAYEGISLLFTQPLQKFSAPPNESPPKGFTVAQFALDYAGWLFRS